MEHLLKWAFCLKHSPFSPFFHIVPGVYHGVTLVLCFLKRPPFFSVFFSHDAQWLSLEKREENLTMVLNSLQPLAIGFTSPCTLLPCTGPYFAKCPSIASSFSLEGQNIVRSFTVEGHVELFFHIIEKSGQ
jgi:cytochrome c biogenesis protein CcdA